MRPIFASLWLAAAAATALAQAPTNKPQVPAGDLAQAVREAQRQEAASADMVRIVGDFKALMEDAASNQVLAESEGDVLEEISSSVGEIDQKHVRAAAVYLRRAIAEPQQSKPRIAAAHGEINQAVDRLSSLLQKFNALRAEERIASAIREIIEEHEGVMQESSQLGKELLEGKPPSADPAELAQQQAKVVHRVRTLEDLFRGALESELTPESRAKLEAASGVLKERQIPSQLDAAAKALKQEDVIPAVEKQKQVMADLKEVAALVSGHQRLSALPSEENAQARREQLENLLRDQKKLREQIEQMGKPAFDDAAPDAQLAQLNLAQRLAEIAPDSPPAAPPPPSESAPPATSPPATPPAGSPPAAGPPQQPAPKDTEPPKDAAPPPQGGAKSQQKGAGSGQGKIPKPFPGAPGAGAPKGSPGTPMQQAANALAAQQQAAAVQAMQAAEAALAKAFPQAQGDAQTGTTPGQGKGGKGGEGQGGGQGKGDGQGKLAGKGKPGGHGRGAGRGGQGAFTPGDVEGALPDETRSSWQPLSQQERRALNENFARELPQEYREMLKAYYEFLSTQ